MVRKIVAVVGGLFFGSIFNSAVVQVCTWIYGPEGGVDFSDPAATRAYIESLPVGALLLVLVAHGGGSFVGGAVCALIAQKKWILGATLVGAPFLLGGIFMLRMVPAPIWFAVVDVLLYVPLAIMGCVAASAWGGLADDRDAT